MILILHISSFPKYICWPILPPILWGVPLLISVSALCAALSSALLCSVHWGHLVILWLSALFLNWESSEHHLDSTILFYSWKLSQNRKLGQFPGSFLFVSWLSGLLPFVSCCPVSWKSLFYMLSPTVGEFRWEDKSDPYYYIVAGSRGHINIFWYTTL